MALQGYYMVKCDCQTSDMVKVGFLTRVRPFVWRGDLRNEIKNTALWQSSPFQFHLFPGSLSWNKKGIMAPVMMVEVERDEVSTGLEFFPLSSCGLSYLFFTLYQNQLTDLERFDIIRDANHHIGEVDLLHLHGFQEIDSLVALKQGVKVQLRSYCYVCGPTKQTIIYSSKWKKRPPSNPSSVPSTRSIERPSCLTCPICPYWLETAL
jgi:hypothetical protein